MVLLNAFFSLKTLPDNNVDSVLMANRDTLRALGREYCNAK